MEKLEQVYSTGIDIDPEGWDEIYEGFEVGPSIVSRIDWSKSIETEDEGVRSALLDGVTQYHYSNIAHLMACGKLIDLAEDMETKKLATMVAVTKVRNIDLFSRVLGKLGGQSNLSDEARKFMRKMHAGETTDYLLLDMAIVGFISGKEVFKVTDKANEPLIDEVRLAVVEQKEQQLDLFSRHLKEKFSGLDEEKKEGYRNRVIKMVELGNRIIDYHQDNLETLGADIEELKENVWKETDEFSQNVGLGPLKP